MKYSIIALSYNHWEQTHQFLMDVHEKIHGDYEIIIVDNNSEKECFKGLEWWKKVKSFPLNVVYSDENLGFGGGNNLGADVAKGEFIIFTQPDVRIYYNFLEYFEQENRYRCLTTLFGARIIDWDSGWNTFNVVGKRYMFPYLEGFFLGCRKDFWNQVGGFDEIYYPIDFEDVDLSTKVVFNGGTLVCLPEIAQILEHNQGSISADQVADREELTKKHQRIFSKKWIKYIPQVGKEI